MILIISSTIIDIFCSLSHLVYFLVVATVREGYIRSFIGQIVYNTTSTRNSTHIEHLPQLPQRYTYTRSPNEPKTEIAIRRRYSMLYIYTLYSLHAFQQALWQAPTVAVIKPTAPVGRPRCRHQTWHAAACVPPFRMRVQYVNRYLSYGGIYHRAKAL